MTKISIKIPNQITKNKQDILSYLGCSKQIEQSKIEKSIIKHHIHKIIKK
jgi:hypothetical protein